MQEDSSNFIISSLVTLAEERDFYMDKMNLFIKSVRGIGLHQHCKEKPFSSFVVMEVILMEDLLLFSSFDGGKLMGEQTDGGKYDGCTEKIKVF